MEEGYSSDRELIEKTKLGDKQAFTVLFDRYEHKILGYLYRYVGDFQAAEDLTIDTFLNAYNHLSNYEERGTFSAWLYTIATNCAKKEFRKRNRLKEVALEEPIDGKVESPALGDMIADESKRPDSEAMKREFKEFIYKVLRKLDKKYKDVLLLCVVEGLQYEEAANILKCSAITIGTRLRRGRKMLYDALKRHGYQL